MCNKNFSLTRFSALIENSKNLNQLKQIHAKSITFGISYSQSILTKLIKSFNNDLIYATHLFNHTNVHDIFIWNSMIRAHSSSTSPLFALSLYNKLRVSENVKVDNFTFPFVFRACANANEEQKGKEVHGFVIKIGFDLDRFVKSSLLSFYTVCCEIDSARRVFDETAEKDVVFWNAMITGYARVGVVEGAFDVFKEMLELEELEEMNPLPNEGTVVGLVSACLVLKDVDLGRVIHGYVMKNVDLYGGVKLGASLVDFYAKCGCMSDAKNVFEEMTGRNTVVWNSLIAGYLQNGCPRQAIDVFREMYSSAVKPDKFTISGVFSACAQLGAFNLGSWVQKYAGRNRIWDVFVGTALIDMYAKCGFVSKAREEFGQMPVKNVASWNAILSGFASHGQAQCTLDLFYEMEKSGAKPNAISFVAILSACAHAGFVEKGREYFDLMVKYYKIPPKVEHYGCMVDLLGRAGLLSEAKELIEKMEIEPNVVVWGALLGACNVHGDVEIGEWAAHHVFHLDPMDVGSYVLLSNVYAKAGRFDEVRVVRELMAQRGVKKPPGCSMIEVGDVVHEFIVADKANPRAEEVYAMLADLYRTLERERYEPNVALDAES